MNISECPKDAIYQGRHLYFKDVYRELLLIKKNNLSSYKIHIDETLPNREEFLKKCFCLGLKKEALGPLTSDVGICVSHQDSPRKNDSSHASLVLKSRTSRSQHLMACGRAASFSNGSFTTENQFSLVETAWRLGVNTCGPKEFRLALSRLFQTKGLLQGGSKDRSSDASSFARLVIEDLDRPGRSRTKDFPLLLLKNCQVYPKAPLGISCFLPPQKWQLAQRRQEAKLQQLIQLKEDKQPNTNEKQRRLSAPPLLKFNEAGPAQTSKVVAKRKSEGVFVNNTPAVNKKGGYCEWCRESFSDEVEQHCRSAAHSQNVLPEEFNELQQFIDDWKEIPITISPENSKEDSISPEDDNHNPFSFTEKDPCEEVTPSKIEGLKDALSNRLSLAVQKALVSRTSQRYKDGLDVSSASKIDAKLEQSLGLIRRAGNSSRRPELEKKKGYKESGQQIPFLPKAVVPPETPKKKTSSKMAFLKNLSEFNGTSLPRGLEDAAEPKCVPVTISSDTFDGPEERCEEAFSVDPLPKEDCMEQTAVQLEKNKLKKDPVKPKTLAAAYLTSVVTPAKSSDLTCGSTVIKASSVTYSKKAAKTVGNINDNGRSQKAQQPNLSNITENNGDFASLDKFKEREILAPTSTSKKKPVSLPFGSYFCEKENFNSANMEAKQFFQGLEKYKPESLNLQSPGQLIEIFDDARLKQIEQHIDEKWAAQRCKPWRPQQTARKPDPICLATTACSKETLHQDSPTKSVEDSKVHPCRNVETGLTTPTIKQSTSSVALQPVALEGQQRQSSRRVTSLFVTPPKHCSLFSDTSPIPRKAGSNPLQGDIFDGNEDAFIPRKRGRLASPAKSEKGKEFFMRKDLFHGPQLKLNKQTFKRRNPNVSEPSKPSMLSGSLFKEVQSEQKVALKKQDSRKMPAFFSDSHNSTISHHQAKRIFPQRDSFGDEDNENNELVPQRIFSEVPTKSFYGASNNNTDTASSIRTEKQVAPPKTTSNRKPLARVYGSKQANQDVKRPAVQMFQQAPAKKIAPAWFKKAVPDSLQFLTDEGNFQENKFKTSRKVINFRETNNENRNIINIQERPHNPKSLS